MGNSSAPAKMFAPATPFGASPQTPIASPVQPLAQNTGTQTPAMSGYQMQPNQPITSPMNQPNYGNGINRQDLINQLRANRQLNSGGARTPFYG